jgi:hypothetical protein
MRHLLLPIATLAVVAPAAPADEPRPVFEDHFAGRLADGWHWLREDPGAWRVKDRALEIRIQPGKADTVKNALVRPAPDRGAGAWAIEVTVASTAPPSRQYEQEGITWYRDGRPAFKLVRELVDGKVVVVPGKHPVTAERVRLRLEVRGDKYTARYRPGDQGEWQTAASGQLPPAGAGKDEVSLQCYEGPADVEHWARFTDFRIIRLPDAGPGGAAAIVPEEPSDYRVFQRRSRDAGVIRLRGRLSAESGRLLCRVLGPSSGDPARVVSDWQPIAADPARGRFDGEIPAPAGGWYRVELRQERDGRTLAEATVGHVGVGEVFVVAGQSNSTNHGSERQKTTTGMVASFDGTRWQPADDPQPGVQDGSKGGSFLPAFGDALYEKVRVPVGVAATGAGATSVRQWLPRGERMTNHPTTAAHVRPVGPGEWESTGTLFEGLAKRLDALGPQGCRAVLWHQGESDAGQARAGYPADRQITGRQYREFLETLIRASRRRAGWDVPWFVAQATYHSESDPADEEFRAAQKALWDSGLALEGPDTDALRTGFRAGVHFNGPGLRAHGRLWAEMVGVYLEKVGALGDR